MKLFTLRNMGSAFALVLGIFLIDVFFHTFFNPSDQFETSVYFLVKMSLVFILGVWMSSQKFTVKSIVIGTVIFVSMFGLYYRGVELFTDLEFGARVPDIVLGNNIVMWEEQPYLSTFLWGIAHGLAFAVPSIVIKRRT